MITDYVSSPIAFIEWWNGTPQNRKDILKESGGGIYVPEAMIDSSHEFETGADDGVYEIYRGMINRSLERTPSVAISATYSQTVNTVTFKATVTNLSSTTVSVQNKAAGQAIVYEEYRASKTNHAGRGSAKADISYLRPGRTETFMITVNLSNVVDYSKLHYIVLVDYKTSGTKANGVYDQLQAVVAEPGDVIPPVAFDVSPSSFAYEVKTGDVDMPSDLINLTGDSGQNWTATVDHDFVQINPTEGSIPGVINVTIDKSKLVLGNQSALVLIADDAGLYERAVLVTVSFSLSAFNVTPTSVTFNFSSDDPVPFASVLPSGDAGQSWTASANQDWVTLTPPSGEINHSFRVSVDPSKLSHGYQEAIVTVSDGGGYQSKQVKVRVTYTIILEIHVYLPMTVK